MNISNHIEGAYGSLYYVNDMEKAVKYYKENFNLEPIFESPGWTELSLNGHALCLHALEAGEKSDGKAILIAKVRDLENVVKTLKGRGVEFTQDIRSVCEGGYAAEMIDPSGNNISLFEYKQ